MPKCQEHLKNIQKLYIKQELAVGKRKKKDNKRFHKYQTFFITIYFLQIYSKSTERRQVQTNVGESQTNVDECRQVQTSHQMSVDKSLDEFRPVTRRVQINLDEWRRIKIFLFDPRKIDTCSHLLLLQLCCSRPQRYVNFQSCSFVVYPPLRKVKAQLHLPAMP